MKRTIGLGLALVGFATAATAAPLSLDSPRWQMEGAEAKLVDYQGKQALWLKGAIARLMDAGFDTGVIEFDMAMPTTDQSFPGLLFRGADDANYEHFYLRPHQNGRPDANQYTPVINNMTAWQIFAGTNYETQTTYPIGPWFHVKVEVAEDSARFFVNSDTPTLVVNDLKRDRQPGFLILKGSSGGAYFANVDITPGRPAAAPPEPVAELPAGLIRRWSVSPAMAEAEAVKAARANRPGALKWTPLAVESNGIANLSRVAEPSEETPTVLARMSVRSDRARSVPLRFGFSDQVQVYLNGTLLYAGDDSQGSRDYRFLGTVGLYDTLQLGLKRGDNEIVLVVTEGGGGWAAAAALPEMTGLTTR